MNLNVTKKKIVFSIFSQYIVIVKRFENHISGALDNSSKKISRVTFHVHRCSSCGDISVRSVAKAPHFHPLMQFPNPISQETFIAQTWVTKQNVLRFITCNNVLFTIFSRMYEVIFNNIKIPKNKKNTFSENSSPKAYCFYINIWNKE